MEIITAKSGGWEHRNGGTKTWRRMSLEEYKSPPEYVYMIRMFYADGTAVEPEIRSAWKVKVNGKPKVYKRDASKVRVSVRYGLYDHRQVLYGDSEQYQLFLPRQE